MFARVTTYHADQDTEQLLGKFKETLSDLQLIDGFSHGYFMTDRESGNGVSITVWESEAAMGASAESAEERRRERTEAGVASVLSVATYELGLIAAAPTVEPAHRRAEPLAEHGEEDDEA